jgi:hypothetical protein
MPVGELLGMIVMVVRPIVATSEVEGRPYSQSHPCMISAPKSSYIVVQTETIYVHAVLRGDGLGVAACQCCLSGITVTGCQLECPV